MGVDFYLNSIWKPWLADNMERVFKAADMDATFGAGATIAGTSMMHDEMRASGGYFRNSYNSGDVMWAIAFPGPAPLAACSSRRVTFPSRARAICSR
jgi:hypothetical protein